jgi:TatD DNase family protein
VREAHPAFRRFLEGQDPDIRGVVHCFSGTTDDARFYTARGLFLGITGVVTFPNAQSLRTVVQDIPLERLLLETDAPFLAPQSHRGKRNEPAYLAEIAEKVAELKGVSVEEVERVTDANVVGLFGF